MANNVRKNVNLVLFVLSLLSVSFLTIGCATAQQIEGEIMWQPKEHTERTQRALKTYRKIFGDLKLPINTTNPDYADIINNFIYGDVYHNSDLLTFKEREFITLVSLTTFQSYTLLKQHAIGAVNAGLTAEEVIEAVYHCTPYIGIATAYEAIIKVTEAFVENRIELPLPSRTKVKDGERYEEGVNAQAALFGEGMRRSGEGYSPGTLAETINHYVSAWCFGDFYTRGALDIKTHEFLTMCVLANLGLPQFGPHVRGTFNAGYSKEKIMAAIAQCMPYMGTPRTLNAIRIVDEILAGEGQ
jgi:4-carboxymuconolactone decarboxylase